MTEETRQRLRERFEQILAAQDTSLQTINDLEQIALNIRDEVAKATLEEAAKEIEQEKLDPVESWEIETQTACIAHKLPCRHCQKNAYFKGIRDKTIQTLAGQVTLRRVYYHCLRCRKGFCPEDAKRQISGHMTLRLAQEVTALCACMPYDLALQTLGRLTPVEISGRTAQRLCTQTIAPLVEQYLHQRQEEMLPLPFHSNSSFR